MLLKPLKLLSYITTLLVFVFSYAQATQEDSSNFLVQSTETVCLSTWEAVDTSKGAYEAVLLADARDASAQDSASTASVGVQLQTCVACHGADGNSVNPKWPSLAGQNKKYLLKQLTLFKNKTRSDPLMTPQAANLTEEQMKALASYFSMQKPTPREADADLVSLGQKIYRGGILKKGIPACSSCHGATGLGNPGAGFPRISFQHAEYVVKRLADYRANKFNSYAHGIMMHQVVNNLDDKEIEAVASYAQGLH